MPFEYLFSSSIGLTLFIVALILGKKPKTGADYSLLVWLSVFAANFSAFLIFHTQQSELNTWQLVTLEFTEASIFLHGPLLFIYSQALIRISFRFKLKLLWHFLPFLLCIIVLLFPLYRGTTVNKNIRDILLILKMTSLGIYLSYVLKMLYAHKANVINIFSNTHKKYLNWLLVIAWGVLTVWLIAVTSMCLERFTSINLPKYEGLVTNSGVAFLLFVIGYHGVRQPSLFRTHGEENSQVRKELDDQQAEKYKKSGLTSDDSAQLHKRIIAHIELHKPYLNPEITLYALAQQLNLQANHLSQVINSFEHKNFFDFINTYRIEAVKKAIENKEKGHLTLLGIAFESGFNSKSSFNRTFKRLVGETPSEYRNRFKNSSKASNIWF